MFNNCAIFGRTEFATKLSVIMRSAFTEISEIAFLDNNKIGKNVFLPSKANQFDGVIVPEAYGRGIAFSMMCDLLEHEAENIYILPWSICDAIDEIKLKAEHFFHFGRDFIKGQYANKRVIVYKKELLHFPKYITYLLKKYLGAEILGYLTWDFNAAGTEYCGRKVISFNELGAYIDKVDGIVFTRSDGNYDTEVAMEYAKAAGFRNIYLHNRKLFSTPTVEYADVASIFDVFEQKYQIGKLDIQMSDHCNLNCQGCTHFCGLVESKWLYDFSRYKEHIAKVKEFFSDDLNNITFLGGEPFLNPQLGDFVAYTRKLFPLMLLYVYSNGLLIKNEKIVTDELLRTIRKYNVEVTVTPYAISEDYDIIRRRLIGHGIKHHFIMNRGRIYFSANINMGGNSSVEFCNAQFDSCGIKYCHTMRDGIVAGCWYPLLIKHFNGYFGKTIPVSQDDCIDLMDAAASKEKVYDLLQRPNTVCGYCSYTTGKRFPWARITKDNPPNIEYWTGEHKA